MGSFDRKVGRNQVRLNKKGSGTVTKKTGYRNPRESLGPRGEGDVFFGRKIVLPLALVLLAGLYGGIGIASNSSEVRSTLYWITIGLYVFLAATIFWRRPYLRVNMSWLYTSKFNRDKVIEAANIKSIAVSRSKITIVPKSNDTKWTFSRSLNLFNTDAMSASLEQFAATYKVPFTKQ